MPALCAAAGLTDHIRSMSRLRKKSGLRLFLGGAAVHRCDNRLAFSDGFWCLVPHASLPQSNIQAAEVTLPRGKHFFRNLLLRIT